MLFQVLYFNKDFRRNFERFQNILRYNGYIVLTVELEFWKISENIMVGNSPGENSPGENFMGVNSPSTHLSMHNL